MARPRPDSPLLLDLPLRPDFAVERRAIESGLWPLAGLDEVGRGPLAGPVVAAAVILDPDRIPEGLDDSKRLKPEAREALFEAIVGCALGVSVASVAAAGIDRVNILRASLEAMRRAFYGLPLKAVHALVDGNMMPPGMPGSTQTLVKGDQRSQSIAAASIIAKVVRDRMMGCCGRVHVAYGFEAHMGYATERHRLAIANHGPVARLHRRSFAPFTADAPVLIAAE